ncbi:MAG: CBS domain-containing protein [Nitrospinae bacterium]|nr:CBS domain-containing protein [Nitrospinota bacterium]
MVKVKDRMSRKLNTLPMNSTALDAAKTLTDNKFSSIFIEENGQIAGVVTDTDLIRKVMAPEKSPANTKVGDIMTKNIISIDLNSSLTQASDLMDKSYIRHLGVTENGKIIGVISVRDLIHPVYTDGEGW